ncbi:uncharacterized protein JCM10292_006548 [Rhodotorula paludigena]|uniref:uncharacterized protein n=1 Tax=Rhodotorula paludigena TaxID=86838 RepID=UPI003175730E
MEPQLEPEHAEASTEDYANALDGLTHDPDQEPQDLDIHTPAHTGVKHSWLHRFVPGIERVAASYHLGTYVAAARGPDPPRAWESMPLYVRIGMQALYHGREQARVLGMKRVEELLKQQSIKQGIAFDSPTNATPHIEAFVKTYAIDTSALLEPDLKAYKTFNEFFYRKLKPDARPPAHPDDPDVISSAADCRLTVFESIDAAMSFWIKGKHFTVPDLLGDAALASQFENGEIAIFRLAPADYHRYHAPVSGTVGATTSIEGSYYTVNPVTVNSDLDVFTKNRRDVTVLHTPRPKGQSVPVAFVQIGAMLVGSIRRTVEEVQEVKRADEFGYFAYGGSTVIAVFPPGLVKWDADLLANSEAKLETVVKVGEQIGRFV